MSTSCRRFARAVVSGFLAGAIMAAAVWLLHVFKGQPALPLAMFWRLVGAAVLTRGLACWFLPHMTGSWRRGDP